MTDQNILLRLPDNVHKKKKNEGVYFQKIKREGVVSSDS